MIDTLESAIEMAGIHNFRQFAPSLLAHICFNAENGSAKSLVGAIENLKKINSGDKSVKAIVIWILQLLVGIILFIGIIYLGKLIYSNIFNIQNNNTPNPIFR